MIHENNSHLYMIFHNIYQEILSFINIYINFLIKVLILNF